MSPYIGLQIKPQNDVLGVGLSFMVWTEARGKILTDSRRSSPCLMQVLSQAFGSSGPVHRCGLKFLNTTFPHPMGCKSGPSANQNASAETDITRCLAFQQVIISNIHMSQTRQPVQAQMPLLTRRKRMSSLISFDIHVNVYILSAYLSYFIF